MRIAVLSCFYPYRGGISQFNSCIINELGRAHTVKAFNFKRQYPEFLFPGKTQFVSGKDKAVPVVSEAVLDTANPFSYAAAARKIRQWHPDVLIMRYWMSYFAPSLGYVARHMEPRCKVIGILDNVIPHERHFFDASLTGYFLKGLDGKVTLCDEVAKDLLELEPGSRYTVIPHPLYDHFGQKPSREEAEARLGLKSGCRNLLFFGLIRKYKGLDILLEAFRGLDSSYQLTIAGEPYGSFDEYRSIMESMPEEMRRRIHLFPEYIPDEDVPLYFAAADAVVLPYRSATQSGVSAISCHFEVPLITTDVGGLRQTVADRGTGLVACRPEPDCVRAEIERFFADASIAESCISNIRTERERLSWSRFCKELTMFINTLEK